MIQGKAPLRISLAGGGTDLNYVFDKYGGAVVNTTIDKYVHMAIEKRKDNLIKINHEILKDQELIKHIIDHYKPQFGFNLYYYNDIKPMSGLGSSSAFTVLLLRLLNELNNRRPNDIELINQAYKIETSLKEGGWQDQYATTFGGFNFIEFKDSITSYPLRLKYSFLCELQENLLLLDIGGIRSGDIHKAIRKEIKPEKTAKIKELAYLMRDCLLKSDITPIGSILNENWNIKKNKFTSNPRIDFIYDTALSNGADGGKICGAGDAGHMLLFCNPINRHNLVNNLKRINDVKIVDFNFSIHGAETW